MRNIRFHFVILLSSLLLAGCYDIKEFTLNPDGSGKMEQVNSLLSTPQGSSRQDWRATRFFGRPALPR